MVCMSPSSSVNLSLDSSAFWIVHQSKHLFFIKYLILGTVFWDSNTKQMKITLKWFTEHLKVKDIWFRILRWLFYHKVCMPHTCEKSWSPARSAEAECLPCMHAERRQLTSSRQMLSEWPCPSHLPLSFLGDTRLYSAEEHKPACGATCCVLEPIRASITKYMNQSNSSLCNRTETGINFQVGHQSAKVCNVMLTQRSPTNTILLLILQSCYKCNVEFYVLLTKNTFI